MIGAWCFCTLRRLACVVELEGAVLAFQLQNAWEVKPLLDGKQASQPPAAHRCIAFAEVYVLLPGCPGMLCCIGLLAKTPELAPIQRCGTHQVMALLGMSKGGPKLKTVLDGIKDWQFARPQGTVEQLTEWLQQQHVA